MQRRTSIVIFVLLSTIALGLTYKITNELKTTKIDILPNILIASNNQSSNEINQTEYFEVTRIIDGDTIEINSRSETIKIRLIGVNTPETVDPRRKVECFGKEASAYTKEILQNRKISIKYDKTQSKTDKYGRLLAYVFRDDGLFVNKEIITNGYGYEYTYIIPYEYQNDFKEAEVYAKQNQLGLWGDRCNQK